MLKRKLGSEDYFVYIYVEVRIYVCECMCVYIFVSSLCDKLKKKKKTQQKQSLVIKDEIGWIENVIIDDLQTIYTSS